MIFYRNLREITFRLTNVIPERIIFVSRGITVLITFTLQSAVRQFHSFFQSKFSTQCNLVLPLSISSALPFPAYFFLVLRLSSHCKLINLICRFSGTFSFNIFNGKASHNNSASEILKSWNSCRNLESKERAVIIIELTQGK